MKFLFEPEELREICKPAEGLEFRPMVETLVGRLRDRYGDYINPEAPEGWIWNLAGGVTGVINVLHGSLSEYLLLFGTPLGSDGFSGRYRIDIWDFMLAGEMWTYHDDSPGTRVVSKPGDWTLLKKGRAKGCKFAPDTWMLEYGRGPVPTCLPMGLGDSVFSALEGTTIYNTVKTYGKLTVKNLLRGKI